MAPIRKRNIGNLDKKSSTMYCVYRIVLENTFIKDRGLLWHHRLKFAN